jgi:hypothetical protein
MLDVMEQSIWLENKYYWREPLTISIAMFAKNREAVKRLDTFVPQDKSK